MPTKRRPKAAKPKITITPRAIALFKEMVALPDCCCALTEPDDCPRCQSWWTLPGQLFVKLKLAPWQWPAIAYPNAECAFAPDEMGGIWFSKAQALYRDLERAAMAKWLP